MNDCPPIDTKGQGHARAGLVTQVIHEIARDLQSVKVFGRANQDWVRQMCAAAADPSPATFSACTAQMREAGITAATIAEVYVPIVARELGDRWVADRLDFRAVSVGSARLQALLWRLSGDWAQTGTLVSRGRPPVLVAVPRGCQHTLGATVLAGQLRYRGISAQLELEFDGGATGQSAANKQYSAVFLSASAREPLETLGGLVQKARHAYPTIPILLGGNVTDQNADIQVHTGADLVTSDLDAALAYIGFGSSAAMPAGKRQVG